MLLFTYSAETKLDDIFNIFNMQKTVLEKHFDLFFGSLNFKCLFMNKRESHILSSKILVFFKNSNEK